MSTSSSFCGHAYKAVHVLIGALVMIVLCVPGLRAQFVHADTGERVEVNANVLQNVQEKKFGYALRSKVWVDAYQKPLHELSVCWEGPPIDQTQQADRALVRAAVAETWMRYADLTFVGWKECGPKGAHIRIKISDERPYTDGLGNALDHKPAGMVLNFTFKLWAPGCKSNVTMRELCVRSIAVHEFGHALAFAHEQNRTDKAQSCHEPTQGPDGDTKLTKYDPDSVMNYCNPRYNNFGKLSYYDVMSVQTLYGLPKNTEVAS